jgi:hypothetical protein
MMDDKTEDPAIAVLRRRLEELTAEMQRHELELAMVKARREEIMDAMDLVARNGRKKPGPKGREYTGPVLTRANLTGDSDYETSEQHE